MKISLFQILVISLILTQSIIAQDKPSFNFYEWTKNYPSHFIDGFEQSFLKNNQTTYLFSTSILILTLSKFDKEISRELANNPFMSNSLSNIADDYGKTFGWGYFAGIGFITCESFINKNDFRDYFLKIEQVLESIAMTQLITQTLKVTTFRERPNKSDNHSFPSGHSSSTFAMAASLESIYGIEVGIPAYIFATIVGLQRINSNSHYLSDVLSGAAIGIFISKGFSALHTNYNQSTKTLNFIPYFNPNNSTYNFQLSLNF